MSQFRRILEFSLKILVLSIYSSAAILSQKLYFTRLKILRDPNRGGREREVLIKYKAFSINSVISNLDIQFHLLSNKERSTTLGEQFCSP